MSQRFFKCYRPEVWVITSLDYGVVLQCLKMCTWHPVCLVTNQLCEWGLLLLLSKYAALKSDQSGSLLQSRKYATTKFTTWSHIKAIAFTYVAGRYLVCVARQHSTSAGGLIDNHVFSLCRVSAQYSLTTEYPSSMAHALFRNLWETK